MHTVPSPQSKTAWGAGMCALIFRQKPRMVEDDGHGNPQEKLAARQLSAYALRTNRGKDMFSRVMGGDAVCREFGANGVCTVVGWIRPRDGKSPALAVVVTAQDAVWYAIDTAPERHREIPYRQPGRMRQISDVAPRSTNHAQAMEAIIRRVYAARFSGQSPALNS